MTEIAVTLGILLVIALLTLLASYNALMELRQQVRAAWGDMDAQLKRRYELLPTLVNLVESAGAAESTRLSAVVIAKHQAAVAFNPPELAKAEAALSNALRTVFTSAASESALIADPRFTTIRQKLVDCDAMIQSSREQYNDCVLAFNSTAAGFPNRMSAVIFGFTPQPVFEMPGSLND